MKTLNMNTRKKTTKRHFLLYQKYVKEYAVKWGLNSTAFFFYHEDLEGCYANNGGNLVNRTVSFSLNTSWEESGGRLLNEKELKKTAKHEVIHMLLAELSACAYERFLTEVTVDRAVETLTVNLENIIPD